MLSFNSFIYFSFSLGIDVRSGDVVQDRWYKLKSKAINHLSELKKTGNKYLATPNYYKIIWKNFAERSSYLVDGIPYGMDSGELVDLSDVAGGENDVEECGVDEEADEESNDGQDESGPLFTQDDNTPTTSAELSGVSTVLCGVTPQSQMSTQDVTAKLGKPSASSTPTLSLSSETFGSGKSVAKSGFVTARSMLQEVTGIDQSSNLSANLSKKRASTDNMSQSGSGNKCFFLTIITK
jgi:hypothetical protein